VSSPRRFFRLLDRDVLCGLRIGMIAHLKQLDGPMDDGELVIEIMRNTPRKPAHGLHFLDRACCSVRNAKSRPLISAHTSIFLLFSVNAANVMFSM
jgi:hypothetical protein